MSSTSKPKHTTVDKGSMKALLEIYLDGDERARSWRDSLFNKRCKWYKYMQGTKYVVDLI